VVVPGAYRRCRSGAGASRVDRHLLPRTGPTNHFLSIPAIEGSLEAAFFRAQAWDEITVICGEMRRLGFDCFEMFLSAVGLARPAGDICIREAMSPRQTRALR
jgi:hypothetical protein